MNPDKDHKSDKSALLSKWLNRKKEDNKPKGVRQRPESVNVPLSFGQERLYFLQEIFPDNVAYNFSKVYRLSGNLNVELLFQSIRKVINRHEVLRTNFIPEEGSILQKVRDQEFSPEFHDLSDYPLAERSHEANRRIKGLISQPFDLEKDLLVRTDLLKLDKEEHLLVVCFHHIVTDAWSLPVFLKEIALLYDGKKLSDLPVQYADFAYWQRQQKISEKNLNYWVKRLSGSEPLNLPLDYSRPAQQTFNGAQVKTQFDAALTKQLNELAQKHQTTLFTVLATAFFILLHRYTNQEDISIGTPFTERGDKSLDPLIGFFVNTLILRSNLSGNPTFTELLENVKKDTLEAFSHSKIPFEKLVDQLAPNRNLDRNPLFDVMMVYLNEADTLFNPGGMKTEAIDIDPEVSKFDLTLFCYPDSNGLSVMMEYNTDLFKRTRMNRMLEHLNLLLTGITKNPNQAVSTIPLLSEAETLRLTSQWSVDRTFVPEKQLIHEWIEHHANLNPHQVAVSCNGQTLTYADLNEKANFLAKLLVEKGAKANVPIGICTAASLEMIVGITGILKSGAAYLPIDPEYPDDRIAFMVKDSGIKLLVTTQEIDLIETEQDVSLIYLNALNTKDDSPFNPTKVNGEDLAYIIYTSGSTGKPKGVKVSHRNIVNSTEARFHYYPDNLKRFLLLSSFAFDSSMVGIFWTLCSGGELVLPHRRIEQDIDQLSEIIHTSQISHTLMLPSLYSVLLDHANDHQLQSLKVVMVAGEACSPKIVQQHFELLPTAELYNEYGPTEATVWCTVHKLTPEDGQGPVSIGRPVPNAAIFLLDQNFSPVPTGIPGELFVGGPGITQGYLNRPELNKERFIRLSFPDFDNELCYRTGDLVRYREDGRLEFLGRADHQVKIRGFRIEPGEIAAVLMQHNSIAEAIVVVKEDQTNQSKKLVAYYSVSEKVDKNSLRLFLKDGLPEYMVPSGFIELEKFPRLPNGKIDRKSLPENVMGTGEVNRDYTRPVSPTETTLAEIWSSILNIPKIGIHDNFFEIGGDSILSIRIVARARKAGLKMKPDYPFKYQTIAELGRAIEAQESLSISNNGKHHHEPK